MTETATPATDATEAALRARLEADPADVGALRDLAIALSERGDHDEAKALIARAVDASPNALGLRLTAAGIRANGGDLDAADKDYRKALTLHPGAAPAEIGRGQIAELRDDWESAERHFRAALKDQREDVDALLGLGRVRLIRGDAEEAVQIFGRATQLYPQHARALANYGQALLLRGSPDVAARPLIRALELDDSLTEARVLLGHAEMARGQPAEAETAYRGVLDRAPSLVARVGLGDALRAQGRYREAADEYAAVLAEMPDNEGVVTSHALSLARGDNPDGAVDELRAFIARFPRCESPRLLLANIFDASGHPDEALDLWRRAAEADPEDGLAHAELALRLEASRDLAGAAKVSAGAATDPRPDVALLRARVAIREGDFARAQRELLSVDPHRVPPALAHDRYRLLGLVHDHNGRYAEATLAFREAQRVDAKMLPVIADPEQLGAAMEPLMNAPVLDPPRVTPPVLLLGLPGSGVERIAALIADQPGVALREDRFANQLDLFGDGAEPRVLTDMAPHPLEVQARRYARGVERVFGTVPPLLVDWIPALDGRVLGLARRALPGIRAIIVETDPEQAFLDWLAFGYQHQFRIEEPVDAAQWWHVARQQIEMAAKMMPTLRLDAQAVFADPVAAAKPLADFLGLEAIKPGPRYAARSDNGFGLPTRFPAGHAEHYRGVLAEAFAALR